MNKLYKCVFALALIMTASTVNAQDLARKIPADALAVVTVKGKNITDLLSAEEFSRTVAGSELINKLNEKGKGSFKSLADLGFDLNASFYYYNTTNDSITYHCFLAPVKHTEQIDAMFDRAEEKFTIERDLRIHYNKDSTEVAYWNKECLLFIVGSARDSYFKREEVSARLGINRKTESDYATDVEFSPEGVATEVYDIPPPATEKPKKQVKKKQSAVTKKKQGKKKASAAKKSKSKKKPEAEVLNSEEDWAADSTDYAGYNNLYAPEASVNAWEKDERVKDSLVAREIAIIGKRFFDGQESTSILDNKNFVKSAAQEAEITGWISGTEQLMNTYIPSSILHGFNFLSGYGSANMALHLKGQEIKIKTSLELNNETAAVIKKINAKKLNKKFLKYVDERKMIGYAAYAMDSKAYLEEYPKLLNKIYGSFYADEAQIATDIFTLLLDEEAVSKVLKGDALFIFNGLTEKTTTYTTNEYNEENFETTEVVKTKKEAMPDFLFMTSSDDMRLFNRLIAYGIKKNVVKSNEGYYELQIPKNPLPLYFALKNGIIFFGTDEKELVAIAKDQFKANVSSAQKKLLSRSNFSGYFNPKKLAGKIPASEGENLQNLKTANAILNAMGDVYIHSNPLQGNTYSGEISMKTPANHPNALKYLLSIIEDLRK